MKVRRAGEKSVAALRGTMIVKSEERMLPSERGSSTCSLSALTRSLVRLSQLFVARNASFTRRRPSTTSAAPPASATRIDVVSLKASRWGLRISSMMPAGAAFSLCVPFYRPLTVTISAFNAVWVRQSFSLCFGSTPGNRDAAESVVNVGVMFTRVL